MLSISQVEACKECQPVRIPASDESNGLALIPESNQLWVSHKDDSHLIPPRQTNKKKRWKRIQHYDRGLGEKSFNKACIPVTAGKVRPLEIGYEVTYELIVCYTQRQNDEKHFPEGTLMNPKKWRFP